MEFVKLPLRIGKTHSKGIVTFDIGVQCIQFLAKGLSPHLAEFFPSTVERSLEFVVVKKFGNELGTENHNNRPHGELNFILHSAKSQCMYLLILLESNMSYWYVHLQR